MTLREILIAIGSSIIGGVGAWLIQQFYLNRKERRSNEAQRIIKNPNSERIITNDIFFSLSPGKSIALMKEMLGGATFHSLQDWSIFSEEEVQINSYIYGVKNAWLKITSKDNVSIDTLTVLAGEGLTVEDLLFPCEQSTYAFYDVKVCPELLEGAEHTLIFSMRDNSFAIRYDPGPPHGLNVTYFGYAEKSYEYQQTKDPKLLIGGIITGVCLSRQGQNAYFIYDSELR